MSFDLDPRLAADSVFIADGPLSQLRLMDDARFPWLVLVPRVPGATEWIDLDGAAQRLLLAEINQAGALLRQHFAPIDKLNIGALGNIVRQLHVHVVGRREGDAAWPGPVWGAGTRRSYGGESPAIASALARALDALPPKALPIPPDEDAAMDDTTPALPRREKSVIVLLALLQGLLLYLVEYGDEQGWPVLSDLAGQVPWYTLVLTVPSLMQLSLQRLDDRRFWTNTALTVLVFSLAAGWAAWSVTGAPGTSAGATLTPFAVTIAIVAFVALPYLQVRIAQGRFAAPYDELFALAWQNALTLAVVGVMTGVGWLLLTLWQELFQLIGISFFRDLFRQDPFTYLVSGLFAGLGVLVARTQHRAMQVARNVLFAIFTGFLPLAAFIAVIFLLSLPFTGLAPLRAAASTAFTLSLLVAALVLLLNAVVQNGRASPYPRPLRWLVDAAMLALPVFAAIALHAVVVRLIEHGWTNDRFWALIAVVMLCVYAAGYAWAALRPAGGWMTHLPRVNVAASLVLIGLGLLANSPVLDPNRLAVGSQLARIETETGAALVDEATRDRIEYLRFESGRRGVAALEQLAARPGASDEFAQTLTEIRERPTKLPWDVDEAPPESPEQLAARIRLPEGQPPLPWALIATILKGNDRGDSYCWRFSDCFAHHLDADADGKEEVLLCNFDEYSYASCDVFVESSGAWAAAGRINQWVEDEATRKRTIAALREGRVSAVAPRFQDIQFGDGPPRELEAVSPAAAVGAHLTVDELEGP